MCKENRKTGITGLLLLLYCFVFFLLFFWKSSLVRMKMVIIPFLSSVMVGGRKHPKGLLWSTLSKMCLQLVFVPYHYHKGSRKGSWQQPHLIRYSQWCLNDIWPHPSQPSPLHLETWWSQVALETWWPPPRQTSGIQSSRWPHPFLSQGWRGGVGGGGGGGGGQSTCQWGTPQAWRWNPYCDFFK